MCQLLRELASHITVPLQCYNSCQPLSTRTLVRLHFEINASSVTNEVHEILNVFNNGITGNTTDRKYEK